ncbi:chondroitin sulfate proteoglycan 4 [Rhincodon typus]|uniref:chondroitin sulfate proteoglycan 4 n=1 Tax=Rhincodon typus TaxID=259920 RepID=UPI00202DE0F4|nr:chondroitin sulfate proteoglycan 4 [Rhincodon typus]
MASKRESVLVATTPILHFLTVLLSDIALTSGVSFFGDSYMKVRELGAFTSSRLSVTFLTSKQNGLLFLASGQSDYLLMELYAGVLQVKLELGSGEVILHSQTGLKLNNLVWHDVYLVHENKTLSLTVDELFTTSVQVLGHLNKLNVDNGLYVGGPGEAEIPYLSRESTHFRGCISKAVFNDYDILFSLATHPRYRTVYEIEDGCSNVIVAGDDYPSNFLRPKSYISFSSWNAREEGTFECFLKTSILQAPLLYHAGWQTDFIILEITDGHLRVLLDNGGGIVVLDNTRFVSDGKWHNVKMLFNVNFIEVTVDGELSQKQLIDTKKTHLDLQGHLFIGGIDNKTSFELIKRGLSNGLMEGTISGSFIGCIQNMRVNLEKKGLVDALVTKGISTVCEDEESEELEKSENKLEDEVSATPIPSFHELLTTNAPCMLNKNMSKVFSNFTSLLNLTPLIVKEAGWSTLELIHIHPTIDLSRIGVRNSQVVFKIIQEPRYGTLELNIPGAKSRKAFTLLDVIHHHITYKHDGSEGSLDQLKLEVSVHSKKEIPNCLKQGQRYTFSMKIISVNDPPELTFPNGNVMTILKNTWKTFGPDVIHIVDVDNVCSELRIIIVNRKDPGFVEDVRSPGQRIGEFSCQDLKLGNIRYVNTGAKVSELFLQVTDGEQISDPTPLRIVALKPDVQVGNNSGLILSQGGVSLITISNLSVETNAVKQKVDILYNITEPLYYGEVQKFDDNGKWKPVKTFHQDDIEQGYLRYFSTDPEFRRHDITEKLKFSVTVGQQILENNVFLIKIKRAKITLVKISPNELNNVRRGKITQNELEAAIEGHTIPSDLFRYVILKSPDKGKLQVLDKELHVGSTFTQEDLKQIGLTYEATVRNSEETQDSFQFQVFVGDQHSPVYTYPILIGIDPEVPILMSKPLVVTEGGTQTITKDQLFTIGHSTTAFVYNVSQGPQHGKLIRQPDHEKSITIFTNDDILQEQLMYKHDDSETLEDKIVFVVTEQSKDDDPEVDVVLGTLSIYIRPVNDQPPIRVVNKTFNVTLNGQHLLTTAELRFHDADSDFDDSQLIYTKWGISNGNIVSADDTAHELSRFSQEDMEKKQVLFKHYGAQRGTFQLQVSDGVHQTRTVLEVHALDPYLRIVNNSIFLVHQGEELPILGYLLGVESNMDIWSEEEIVYQITFPPSHGEILVNGELDHSFSQKDINDGRVVYRHDNSQHSKDFFNFMVEVKEIKTKGTFPILIFLERHQYPPIVVHNKKIFVNQGGAKKIWRDQLLVSHNDSVPSDLIYSVKTAPVHGQLVMVTESQPTGQQKPLKSFSQDDINRGRVQYLNSRFSPQGDAFVLDVTNGFKTVDGLTVLVELIPDVIFLVMQNISVKEGDAQALTGDILNVSNYLTSSNFKFYVTKTPKHGRIGRQRLAEESISSFTMQEVKEEAVFYFHDNSETLVDSFTVIANISEIGRQSEPMSVIVTVIPINDEAPVVTINTELKVWEDGIAEISQDLLNSEDPDTPAEELIYSIKPPSNGHVALKSSLDDSILEFTQEQINNGQIIFVHHGALSGGFSFDVSDGVNSAAAQLFTVSARRLNILIETKEPLIVYPGTRQPITSQYLKARTSDINKANDWPLTYTIVTAPSLGQLIRVEEGNVVGKVSNFTERDLESENIFYQHNWPKEPFWKCQDSFEFTVSSPPVVTERKTLTLWISFEKHSLQQGTQLWHNKGLVLPEGQSAAIDQSMLDASNLLASVPKPQQPAYDVIFEVTAQPVHGFLSLADVGKVKHFTQSDLLDSALKYTHTKLGPLTDSFTFQVWLSPRRKSLSHPVDDGSLTVLSELFNITVVPVKDHSPQIMTTGMTLHVLQGSSFVLTPDHMNTVDFDNSPEEILYSIVTGPNNGFFVNQVNDTTAIKQFTQADINAGRVVFKADGQPASSIFQFSVSDGKHSAVIGSVTVEVTPATIHIIHNKDIVLLQGNVSVLITREELLIDTQLNDIVLYKITQQPRYGKIIINQSVVTEFSQKHIDNGDLKYHMRDFSVYQDSFHFSAMTREGNLSGIVNVTVQPLVRVARDLYWPRGTTILIDTDVLDASELANKTHSIPSFNIIQQPKTGKLVKLHRQNGSQSDLRNQFTQSDLEDGHVVMEVWDYGEASPYPEIDSFQFLLKADGVPPGIATFEFRTVPYIPTHHYNATVLKVSSLSGTKLPDFSSSPTSQKGDKMDKYSSTVTWDPYGVARRGNIPTSDNVITESRPTASNEKVLTSAGNNLTVIIIAVILIILLFLIAVIITIYLTKRNKTGKHNVQMPPTKPKNGAVEKETFRKTDHVQSVPLVNVRPLNGVETQSNSGHVNPDAKQFCRTSNPTLKTNQYWV